MVPISLLDLLDRLPPQSPSRDDPREKLGPAQLMIDGRSALHLCDQPINARFAGLAVRQMCAASCEPKELREKKSEEGEPAGARSYQHRKVRQREATTLSAPEMCTLGENQVSSSFTLMSVCGEGVAERVGFDYRHF